jgi:DNA-directed RNA polymerase specialized sigma24 family protein
MSESGVWEGALCEPEEETASDTVISALAARGWRGRLGELEPIELEAFRREALKYGRWEIWQYAVWRGQDEPVLADGFDAEAVVQAAFARLLSREAGGVPIYYTAEGLRHELRALVKHRVRWLHERKETGLQVREWDVLPARDGELVSVFDYLPGTLGRPDQQVLEKEQGQLLGDFKAGFEQSLLRRDLAEVFGGVWAGQKPREIAQRLGAGVERVKSLQRQVNGRLAKFAAAARGGVAEILGTFRKG